MKIKTSLTGQIAVVRLQGRMDAESHRAFDEAATRAMDGEARYIVADIDALTYISSAGIGSFLRISKNLEAKQGELVLVGLNGLVRAVFEITRVITLFRVFDSAAEAVAALPST